MNRHCFVGIGLHSDIRHGEYRAIMIGTDVDSDSCKYNMFNWHTWKGAGLYSDVISNDRLARFDTPLWKFYGKKL